MAMEFGVPKIEKYKNIVHLHGCVCALEMILLSNRQYLLVLPSCSHPYTGTPEQPLQNCQVGIVREKTELVGKPGDKNCEEQPREVGGREPGRKNRENLAANGLV